MKTHEAQEIICRAVRRRGYVDGWTPEQFAARQIAKAAEELAAADATMGIRDAFDINHDWRRLLLLAGSTARDAFDDMDAWNDVWLDTKTLTDELADVVVVLLCAGEALGVDLIAAAVAKAEADIERGVR